MDRGLIRNMICSCYQSRGFEEFRPRTEVLRRGFQIVGDPTVLRRPWPLLIPLILLTGCNVNALSDAANSTRDSAENFVWRSQQHSRDREKILANKAHQIEQEEAHTLAIQTGEKPRYELRKEGATWTVFDTESNQPARIGPHVESKLDDAQAYAVFQDLQGQEELDNAKMMGQSGRQFRTPGSR